MACIPAHMQRPLAISSHTVHPLRHLAPVQILHSQPFCTQLRRHTASRPAQQATRAEGDDARQSTATEKDDELPPWLRKEKLQKMADAEGGLPFGLYLLASSLVAIAAVGSIFEIINQNPLFGVISPGNPLYLPILGTFAVTGFPTTGWLFLKGVNAANELSERMDKIDGGGKR